MNAISIRWLCWEIRINDFEIISIIINMKHNFIIKIYNITINTYLIY